MTIATLIRILIISSLSLLIQSCSLAPEAEFTYQIVAGKKQTLKDKKIVSDSGSSASIPKEAFKTDATVNIDAPSAEEINKIQGLTKDKILAATKISAKSSNGDLLNNPKTDIKVCIPANGETDLSKIIAYESDIQNKQTSQIASSKITLEKSQICVLTKVTNGEIFLTKAASVITNPIVPPTSEVNQNSLVKGFKFFENDANSDTEKTTYQARESTFVKLKSVSETGVVLENIDGILSMTFKGPSNIDSQNFIFTKEDKGQKKIEFVFPEPGSYVVDFDFYGIKSSVTLTVNGTASSSVTIIDNTLTNTLDPLPPDPEGLNLTALNANEIQLNWTSGLKSTAGFQIAYLQGSTPPANCNAGTVVPKTAITATTHIITGLTKETAYAFRLCSLNSNTAPDMSAGITGSINTLGEAVPPTPVNSAGSVISSNEIALSWLSGGGTTVAYRVSYQTGAVAPSSCSVGTQVTGISGLSINVTGLTHETQYSFRICAINNNSTPTISTGAVLSLTTSGLAAPGDASGLIATPQSGGSSVLLSWNGAGGTASGYKIAYQAGASAPASCSLGTVIPSSSVTATTHTVTGLTYESQYSFKVCSINANSVPDVSAGIDITATTLSQNPPPNISNLAISADSTTQMSLSWSSGGGSTSGYKIAYQSGATAPVDCLSGTVIPASSIINTNHSIIGLTFETQYSFRVCSINANSVPDVASGVTVSATTQSLADAPDPTGLSATVNSENQITLNWSSGGGTTSGYRIAYQTGASAPANCASGTTIAANTISGTSKIITGLSNGTQYSFRVCGINANASPNPSSGVTVTATTPALPVITTLSDAVYPLDDISPPLIQGTSYTLANASDADGNNITMTCTYKSLDLNASDPNYATAGTNCNTLSTLATTNSTIYKSTISIPSASTSPSITWKPTSTQRGSFEFTFNAADSTGLSAVTKTLNVTVRENTNTTNLLSSVDALNATSASGLSISTPSAPNPSSSTDATFMNLISTGADGVLTFGTSNPWSGTGATSSPYSLNFTAANSDKFSLSNVLNSQTRFGLTTWVKPSAPTIADQVIASNGGGTGNGFVLRQSATPTGKAEFVVGQKYYSYQDIVLRDKPLGYWRLSDSNTSAIDLSASGYTGTYTGTYTQGQSRVLSQSGETMYSTGFTTGRVTLPAMSVGNTFTIEAWINVDPSASNINGILGNKLGGASTGYALYVNHWNTNDQSLVFETANGSSITAVATNAGAITLGVWNHVVAVINRGSATAKLYLNGAEAVTTGSIFNNFGNTTAPTIGDMNSSTGCYFNGAIGDVALYTSELSATQITEHYQTGAAGNYKPYPGNAILADGPIGYWRLNEGFGSIAYDSSGNSYSGTYSGEVIQNQMGALANDSSKSTSFNGGTSAVPTGYVQAGVTSYSVEAWMKSTWSSGQASIGQNRGPTPGSGKSITLGVNFGALEFALDADNVKCGVSYAGVFDGNWHHIVGVWRSSSGTAVATSQFKLYVDGVAVNTGTTTIGCGTLSAPFTGNGYFTIGYHEAWATAFQGNIQDVAVYTYPLSLTQIQKHYTSSAWWFCQSQTSMNASNWNQLSTLYDGTTAKLFLNGQQECSVTPGTTYSSTVADTSVGNSSSGSNYWSGAMETVSLYGTSNGVTPISAANIQSDFSVTANRIRTQPVEDIVTSNLVYSFDAANAKQGTQPYTNGCAASDLSAWDLSSSQFNGTLKNFASCGASSGWIGNGTTASPYAVALDGSNDYIQLPVMSTDFYTNGITMEIWAYPTAAGNYGRFFDLANGTSSDNLILARLSTGNFLVLSVYQAGLGGDIASTGTISLNTWQHIAVTVTPNGTNANAAFYINGAAAGTGSTRRPNNITRQLNYLGKSHWGTNAYYQGRYGIARVYNAPLTAQQIKQNCLAEEARFTSTPQSICGAP